MSDPITFFRKRQQDVGYTYAFDLQSSTRAYRVFVYSRQALKADLVQPRKLVEYKQEMRRIREAVGSEGAIALTCEENRKRLFLVVCTDDATFRSYGVLRPGSELSLEEELGEDRWLVTPLGTHLLIPVDREAEEHLRNLKEYLAWLPPDLESLILHSIRKPSLDARIGEIEAKVFGDRKSVQTGKLGERLKSWFGRPAPLWPVFSTLLALMLVVNAVLLYSLLQHIDGTIVVPGGFGMGSQAAGGSGSEQTTSTPAQEIFRLATAVRGKSSNPNLAALDQLHFSNLKKEGDVAPVFRATPEGKRLALGLMKLEALRLDSEGASGLFATADNWTEVKKFFRSHNLDSDARDMLAAVGCNAFDIPGLPATQKGTDPAFLFVESCEGSTLDKATPGLEDLTAFVNELGGNR